MADRPLQAVAQDLKSAGRQAVRQRIEGLLDISGGELPELNVAQGFLQRLDGVCGNLVGATGFEPVTPRL
jgi:hypothetical protein